jgi:peptide/nickel transport system substrate-binding protein
MREGSAFTRGSRVVRHSLRASLGLVVAPVLVATLVSACASSGSQSAGATASTSSVLTIGETATIQDLNPYHLFTYDYPFLDELYDPLVRLNDKLQPEPVLATSWHAVDGGRGLELTLRKNVHFANGDPFTSADVKYSVAYAANPANAAQFSSLAQHVTAVQTPSPYSVVLRYAQPNPAPYDLLNELYMLDAKQPDSAVGTSGNGTGAFRVASYQPGLQLELKRNADSWAPAPKLSEIIVKVYPSEQTELEALESGTIDMIHNLSAASYTQVQQRSGLVTGVAGLLGASDYAIQVNVKQVPNVLVRQAISLLLDRSAIARAIGGPGAAPLCLPFPPTSPGYFASLASRCSYDLSKAKQDIQSAHATGMTLSINTSTASSPATTELGQVLQAQAAGAGLNITVNNVDSTTYNNDSAASDFQLEVKSYGRGNGDPAALFGAAHSFYAVGNPSKYTNAAYTNDVAAGASTLNQAARNEDYQAAESIILSSAFVIPVAAVPSYWVSLSEVHGIESNTDGLLLLNNVTIG